MTNPGSAEPLGARGAVWIAYAKRVPAAPVVAAAAAGLFIAVSAWWTLADTQVADGDSGKHLVYAYSYADALANGRPLTVLLAWFEYPPLVHLVGAIGGMVVGRSESVLVITENLVFVPLLVLGCYGIGKLVAGRWAGALAAIFALGTPMLVGLFHVFILDTAAAALVAVSVWLLLASRRFQSTPYVVAAAVAVAAGFHVKPTFILFIGGVIATILVRGGWRNWRGALSFGAIVLILVQPWYFAHFEEIRTQLLGATNAGSVMYSGTTFGSRWSLDNFTFYGWIMANSQLYLPLFSFFVVGTAIALWYALRKRRTNGYFPELLIGLLVAYLGISFISFDDPRYTLPMLAYVAVLGTAWIVRLAHPWRLLVATGLVVVFGVNVFMATFGRGPSVELRMYHPENAHVAGYFAVLRPAGYTESAPNRENTAPRVVGLLKSARADGARSVVFQPESLNVGGLNLWGLTALAWEADLRVPGFASSLVGPQDVYVLRGAANPDIPPCIRFNDDTGLYLVKGPPVGDWKLYCPPGWERV